ncbi:MAG: hypothetical protein ACTSUK_07195 [Promethearchaeota archaeon]
MKKETLRIFSWCLGGVAILFLLLWIFLGAIPAFNNIEYGTGPYFFGPANIPEVIAGMFVNFYFISMIVFFIIAGILGQISITEAEKRQAFETEKKFLTREKPENPPEPRTTKETTIIKEKIKILHLLPDECPSCKAKISQQDVKWSGPLQAACSYCGFAIKLIEKEI